MSAMMWRKRISFALLVGMQAGAATWENSVEVPQRTKNRTTLRPSNGTTRHLSKGYRCAVSKGHMHPNVYSHTIDNSLCKQPKCPSMGEWIKKTSRWPTDRGKNAPHHSSSGKYKSNPQWDTTSHLSEWLTWTTQATTDVGKDVGKEDLFCIAGGNASLCSHSGKQYGGSSKN